MGQPVAVEEKQGRSASVVRFETNRSLTGQGHESFASAADAVGTRPAAVIAQRLFESGKVEAVHVFGNVVTATVKAGQSASGLDDILRNLYQYWKPGMVPPSADELAAQVTDAAPAAAAPSADGGSTAAVDSRVPAHLLERSASARARWKEKHG